MNTKNNSARLVFFLAVAVLPTVLTSDASSYCISRDTGGGYEAVWKNKWTQQWNTGWVENCCVDIRPTGVKWT